MKFFSSLLFFIIISVLVFAQTDKGFAVVELFTSEGNAQSPAAEKILSEIGKESKLSGSSVYCLEYHVDYWNKLGWKDPFSKFQFTRRQENYSRVLPSKEMYTPQIIINGTSEFTGTDEKKIRPAISAALKTVSGIQFSILLDSLKQDTAYISWQLSKEDKNTVLQIAYTESGLSSKVEKGENAGKTLVHDHVVRVFTAVNNPGAKGRIKIYLKDREENQYAVIIAFVQNKQNYKISGVSKATIPLQ